MKKFFGIVVLMLCMAFPGMAQAAGDTGMYVSPKFVFGYQNTDWKLSAPAGSGSSSTTRGIVGFSVAVGYDFEAMYAAPVRVEVEYGYNSRVRKHVGAGWGKSRIQTVLVNGYWDITNYMDFTPYIGIGVGFAAITTRGAVQYGNMQFGASDTDYQLAAQIGVGCSYAFTRNISAEIGYRYLFTGKAEAGIGSYNLKADSIGMHQFAVGLRLSF